MCIRDRGGEVDAVLASLFRVTDGVRFSAERMLLGFDEWEAEFPAGERVTTEDFLGYVEKTELFNSLGGSCGGPPRMVHEFLELMRAGPGEEPPREGAAAAGERLLELVGDLYRAWEYGTVGLLAYLHRRWFELHEWEPVRVLVERLRAAPNGAREEELGPLEEWLREAEARAHFGSAAAARAALAELAAALRARAPGAPRLPAFGEDASAGRPAASRAQAWAAARDASLRWERLHLEAATETQRRVNRVLEREPELDRPFRVTDLEAAAGRPLASSLFARGRGAHGI